MLRSSALTTHHMPRLQVSDSPESRSTMPQQRGAAGLEMMEAVQQVRLWPPWSQRTRGPPAHRPPCVHVPQEQPSALLTEMAEASPNPDPNPNPHPNPNPTLIPTPTPTLALTPTLTLTRRRRRHGARRRRARRSARARARAPPRRLRLHLQGGG